MHPTLRLGRIARIDVGLHWSVIVLMALFTWSLADAALPDLAPGSSDVAYWVAAAIGVLALFASLLAHELAHSVVAERHGVEVDGITLWLLGGVSQLHGEAHSARDELRIAIVGPATSALLAGVFTAAAAVAAGLGLSDLVVAVLAWLGVLNLILAAFNLLPGAPLDGGRVLHAIVWARTHDRGRATEIATTSGAVLGYVMIGGGIVLFFLGDVAAVWFVLLGWFLLSAARAEATHELLEHALAGVRVRDIMSEHPQTIPADVVLDAAVDDWFLRYDCSAFPTVRRDGSVSGLVTLAQVKRVDRAHWPTTTVGDVATPLERLATGAADESVTDLLQRIATTPSSNGRALVLAGNDVVGIVTATDVRRALDLASLRTPRAQTGVHGRGTPTGARA